MTNAAKKYLVEFRDSNGKALGATCTQGTTRKMALMRAVGHCLPDDYKGPVTGFVFQRQHECKKCGSSNLRLKVHAKVSLGVWHVREPDVAYVSDAGLKVLEMEREGDIICDDCGAGFS